MRALGSRIWRPGKIHETAIHTMGVKPLEKVILKYLEVFGKRVSSRNFYCHKFSQKLFKTNKEEVHWKKSNYVDA